VPVSLRTSSFSSRRAPQESDYWLWGLSCSDVDFLSFFRNLTSQTSDLSKLDISDIGLQIRHLKHLISDRTSRYSVWKTIHCFSTFFSTQPFSTSQIHSEIGFWTTKSDLKSDVCDVQFKTGGRKGFFLKHHICRASSLTPIVRGAMSRAIPYRIERSIRTQETVKKNSKKSENLNLHGFELHWPSSKGTKLLFQVIPAMIYLPEPLPTCWCWTRWVKTVYSVWCLPCILSSLCLACTSNVCLANQFLHFEPLGPTKGIKLNWIFCFVDFSGPKETHSKNLESESVRNTK